MKNKGKWLFGAVICALMLLLCLGALAAVPEGYTPIADACDLDAIRFDLDGRYYLTCDIDLGEALSEDGDLYSPYGWLAIGFEDGGSSAFTGVIDGGGHTVFGFTANDTRGQGSSAFVWENRGIIENLTLEGSLTSNGDTVVGALCRTVGEGGLVRNCVSRVAVTWTQTSDVTSYIGGVVGLNHGRLQKLSGEGALSVNARAFSSQNYYRYPKYIGGIAGKSDGVLSDVQNVGEMNISAEHNYSSSGNGYPSLSVGGIAGVLSGSAARCANRCDVTLPEVSNVSYTRFTLGGIAGLTYIADLADVYNSGAMTGSSYPGSGFLQYVGGIVAGYYDSDYVGGKSTTTIRNAYNAGAIAGDNHGIGAIAAYYNNYPAYYGLTLTLTDCYYLNTTSEYSVNNSSYTGATARSKANMKKTAAFSGFDFENVWEMGTGDYLYPVLRAACLHPGMIPVAAVSATCTQD
ncbi:MAG: hypothetical protein IJU41_04765, partial [Clostridia bacterium]|nr:hypothetical protein [Clostridia bacterium]